MGIARLSTNWLVARLATVYVEIIRNMPLLLQLFFWYFAVLKTPAGAAPEPSSCAAARSSTCAGLYLPAPVPEARLRCRRAGLPDRRRGLHRRVLSGPGGARCSPAQQFPRAVDCAGADRCCAARRVLPRRRAARSSTIPALKGFNFVGGMVHAARVHGAAAGPRRSIPASFIAEIVRAGIQGVPKGQKEAASAIGLSQGQTLRLVVIPQAMRIIIPPLTSQLPQPDQELLAGGGHRLSRPRLSVFAGTVLNQTGQAVEVILITMLVYLIAQPDHVGLHELVQRAHGAGGAVRQRAMVADGRRDHRSPPSAHRARSVGAARLDARQPVLLAGATRS